jgi:nucleoid DNA-binding protein/LysM repeat protein
MNTQDIIDAVAQKHGMNKKEATAFIKELFLLIEHTLEKDKTLKLKGFGTFKVIKVSARESVNVNTGERFTIQEHNKIGFIPDTQLRNLLNEPFAHLETVVLENADEKEDIPVQTESVNVNADERFTIQEHNKTGYMPDAELRNLLNEPFTHLETVVLEETAVLENADEKEVIPVQADTLQNSEEKNEENLKKHHSAAPSKKLSVFIACGIVIILSGSIILYMLSSGDEPQKETALPATAVMNETTEIPPVDIYSAEEDLRILTDASPVYPDSVNYIITGTKTTYTVKKGETLTRVSLRFYGTKDLWPYIQKHNHTKIKNPGIITPGMILTIPELKKKDE